MSPTPNGAVRAALDLVRPERVVEVLQALVAVPSLTGSAAESELQAGLAQRLDGMGLDTDHWSIDLDLISRVGGCPGWEAPREEAYGVVGTWHGLDPAAPSVILNSHVDVVPLGDEQAWTTDPWGGAVQDGRVWGRGACDMKAGLACQLVALEVLRTAGVALRGSVALHCVVGEEDGGLGTFATLDRGHHGTAALISEPTSLALVPAAAGALTFRLEVPGRSTHGSMRTDGVDAVEKYLLVHRALRALEAERNQDPHPLMRHSPLPYPLSVGTVRAGDWASSVPDLLVAEGRYGVALGEDVVQARSVLEQRLADVSASDPWLVDNPVRLTWYGGQFAPGALADGDPLLDRAQAAHTAVAGSAAPVHGAPYGSDLRLYTAAGIPTLHYGPGDIRVAHAPDEHVAISELVTATQTLVLLVADLTGSA